MISEHLFPTSFNMQKHTFSVIAVLLFAASFSTSTVSGIVDNIGDMVLDIVNKHIISKISDIVGGVAKLPANLIDSTPIVSQFINDFIQLGIKYTSKTEHLSIQYLLFTPVEPSKEFNLQLSKESLNNSTFNASLETKFLIHGFLTGLKKSNVVFDIKDQLLQKNDYNVIVVNWTKYNGFPYAEASVNAAFVGFEIAKLIQFLMISEGISPRSVHLIGHSLGGQSAGFTGKVVPNIGRISGLDAAGPIFQDLPKSLKLTNTDAEFVDAMHANGASTLLEGFGTLGPYADIDFFPNGGSQQPGCNVGDTFRGTDNHKKSAANFIESNVCNHDRALFLFLNSINHCRFASVHCSSYKDFKEGGCPQKISTVSRMGFHASPVPSLPSYSKFYLNTTGHSPFCTDSS